MKSKKFWIEIVLIGAGIACTLALLVASLGVAAETVDGHTFQPQTTPAITDQPEQTYEGMVSCSRCGAQHPPALNSSATKCVLTCVRGGETFVLVGIESTYLLDGDLPELKKLAGQRARVVGALHGKTIRVSSAVAGT